MPRLLAQISEFYLNSIIFPSIRFFQSFYYVFKQEVKQIGRYITTRIFIHNMDGPQEDLQCTCLHQITTFCLCELIIIKYLLFSKIFSWGFFPPRIDPRNTVSPRTIFFPKMGISSIYQRCSTFRHFMMI